MHSMPDQDKSIVCAYHSWYVFFKGHMYVRGVYQRMTHQYACTIIMLWPGTKETIINLIQIGEQGDSMIRSSF